jgi:putative ABC transport system ATP-binding protein
MEVMQVLRDLATRHDKAAVVVSHDPRLEEIADRVLQLEDGRLVPGSTAAAASTGRWETPP